MKKVIEKVEDARKNRQSVCLSHPAKIPNIQQHGPKQTKAGYGSQQFCLVKSVVGHEIKHVHK